MTVVKKSFKLKPMKQEEPMRQHRVRQWFSKWDRTIAAITALVVFCVLLILVIVNIKTDGEDNDKPEESSSVKVPSIREYDVKFNIIEPKILGRCSLEGNVISCRDIAIENLCSTVNEYVESIGMTEIKNLHLTDITFKDDTLEEGWSDCLCLKLTDLTILGSTLKNVSPTAFNANNLSLKTLTLSSVDVATFRKDMFEGLSLNRLSITCFSSNRHFEENVFEATAQTLQSLQIQNCITQLGNTDVLSNITGAGQQFGALREIDLRSNNLRKVRATNFRGALSVTTLHLSDSSIAQIEPHSFDDMYLEILNLQNNNLKTLPIGIFSDVKIGISLIGNKFRCDCDLDWLKQLVVKKPELFSQPMFYCELDDGSIVLYTKGPFCNENVTTTSARTEKTTKVTSSTPISTIPVTTSTVTINPEPSPTTSSPISATTSIKCQQLESSNIPFDFENVGKVTVRNETVEISFFLVEHPKYLLRITGALISSTYQDLLWFNNNKSKIGCAKNVSDGTELILDHVEKNETFMFCLKDEVDNLVSPLDCGALLIPLDTTAWLTEDDMVPIICGFCGSLILISFITGFIVFYCVRQHPSLIKGNKRVIIVESKAADAIVMPPYYDEISYNPPSLNSYSNGYLTPKHRCIYSPPRPNSRLRTISEHTDFAIPSTSSQERMKRSHYRKRTRLEHVSRAFDEHVYEPPPLPPNHPLGFSHSDSFSRSYSRV